jgi:redox-sensitive bicupin YhaK (pirin superfamily)
MSAGTGLMHSEFSKDEGDLVKFLQIWFIPIKEM